jgi:predicted Holliday junction resolvase-like endonuclease
MQNLNSQVVLIVALFIVCMFIFLNLGRWIERADWKGRRLEAVVKERLKASRAVLGGLVSEQIAPLLRDFPFDPGDCRFVGKPVDFIVFRGMNQKKIQEVIFLEVKTGSSTLNDQEKRLKEAIEAGRVRWVQYNR